MPLHMSINMGFITNSSSAITYVPKEVLEHPRVKAFLARYGVEGGYLPDNIWYRSSCDSILIGEEMQSEVAREFADPEWPLPSLHYPDGATVVYGDEYESLASSFVDLCSDVYSELYPEAGWLSGTSFN